MSIHQLRVDTDTRVSRYVCVGGCGGDYSEHIHLVQYRTTVEPLLKEIPEFLVASLNKTHFLISRVSIVEEFHCTCLCWGLPFEHGPADCEPVFKVCLSCKVYQSR